MNEELTSAAPELTSEPVPTSPPVLELPPDYDPDAEPSPVPMEVISVDELLERLTQQEGGELEAPAEGDELGEVLAEVPVPEPDPVLIILEQVGGKLIDMIGNLDRIEEYTETIQMQVDIIELIVNHPALTTSFAEYTVTEALLLFLLLAAFIAACARMLRGGLSWLRS